MSLLSLSFYFTHSLTLYITQSSLNVTPLTYVSKQWSFLHCHPLLSLTIYVTLFTLTLLSLTLPVTHLLLCRSLVSLPLNITHFSYIVTHLPYTPSHYTLLHFHWLLSCTLYHSLFLHCHPLSFHSHSPLSVTLSLTPLSLTIYVTHTAYTVTPCPFTPIHPLPSIMSLTPLSQTFYHSLLHGQ